MTSEPKLIPFKFLTLLTIVVLIIIFQIFLVILIYKDLTHKIRYRDDPNTKQEWFEKGYKDGLEAAKPRYFIEGYLKGVADARD